MCGWFTAFVSKNALLNQLNNYGHTDTAQYNYAKKE